MKKDEQTCEIRLWTRGRIVDGVMVHCVGLIRIRACDIDAAIISPPFELPL